MRRSLVVGNWKMHGSSASIADLLAGLKHDLSVRLDTVDIAVCPPYLFIPQVAELLQGSLLTVGAQNVSDQLEGAYTGEISAAMLAEFGCRYVIVGHSERRAIYGETDQQVAAKFAAVQSLGMLPILCVGETLQQRESGKALELVGQQVSAVVELVGVAAMSRAVVAYEPVWAIGTGKTASSAQAQEVHAHIRQVLAAFDSNIAADIQILYGGSVKPDNAAELFANQDIDGALVGGASLQSADFSAICKAAM
ncbi:MAG: triose-phosphate isomerase [Spongiibacteraceae bacterium]